MNEVKISRLKLERVSRGWSMAQVAEMAGVSTSALAQWEAKKQTPAVSTAIRLAALYKVDITDLFSAKGCK